MARAPRRSPFAQKIPHRQYVRLRRPTWAVFDHRNSPWLVTFATSKRKAIAKFMADAGTKSGPGSDWAYWYRAGFRAEEIALKLMKV